MLQERGTFIPRGIVVLAATLGIICALLIGVFAFLLPAVRIRREYVAATCMVVSASISCGGECRNATVASSSFPGLAIIIRSGRGTAPCDSAATCHEQFTCRFKETPDGVAVREDIAAFPPGMALFVALAGILAVGLGLYLSHDALRACGWDLTSATPVRVVLFAPPGIDVRALVCAVKARWPRVEARGLSYRTYVDEDGRVAVEALRAFETEVGPGVAGLVFCIGADGRNEQAVLDAVPETFYRVLVLPTLEDCVDVVCGTESKKGEVNKEAHHGVSEMTGSGVATCEVEQAHQALTQMADLFDSVYTVGALEFRNDRWIAMRAISPYVPFRLGFVSVWDRLRAAIWNASSRMLTAVTWPKPGRPRGATDQENS